MALSVGDETMQVFLISLAMVGGLASCDNSGATPTKAATKQEEPSNVQAKAKPKAQTKPDVTPKAQAKTPVADNNGDAASKEHEEPPTGGLEQLAAGPLLFDPAEGPGGKLPFEPKAGESEGPSSSTWSFGWTEDSATFAWCQNDASDEGGTCHTISVDGKTKAKTFMADKWAAFANKQGPLERGLDEWSFGDITLTQKRDGGKLTIGGRAAAVGGEDRLASFEFDAETYADGDVGLGYVSIAPNGRHLVLVGAAVLGFTDEALKPKMMASGALAASVYEAHGFAALKAKQPELAAKWFERAAQASHAWKHPYNQACALARGKLEGSEQALAEAIKRGGAKVIKKAKTDKDLENVRDQAWFVKLMDA